MLTLPSISKTNWQASILVFLIGIVIIITSGITVKDNLTVLTILSLLSGILYLSYSVTILFVRKRDFIYRAIIAFCIFSEEMIIYVLKKTNILSLSFSEVLNFDLSSLLPLLFPGFLIYIAIIYDIKNYLEVKRNFEPLDTYFNSN